MVEHLVLIETAEDSDIFYADTLYTTLEGYFSTTFQVPQSASAVFFVYTYDCQDGKLLQTLQLNDGQVNPQTVEFPICTGELSCQARFGFRKEAPGTREYVFRNESFGSFSSLLWEIGEEGELGREENEDEFVFSFPDEGEFKEFDLLQLYMELPIYPSEEEIANQLLLINLKAVLGHAGVNQSQELYWRHMWPIPRGLPIVPSVLLEILQFFVFSAELGTKELLSGKY